jgi:hypothetical protein
MEEYLCMSYRGVVTLPTCLYKAPREQCMACQTPFREPVMLQLTVLYSVFWMISARLG